MSCESSGNGCGKGLAYVTTTTSGCHTLISKSSYYRILLEKNGFKLTDDPGKASLIIVNTCGSGDFEEENSYKVIDELMRSKHEGAELIIVGCMVALYRERIRGKYGVEVFGLAEEEELSRYLELKNGLADGDLRYGGDIKSLNEDLGRFSRYWAVLDGINRFFIRVLPPLGRTLSLYHNTTYSYSPGTYLIQVCTGCVYNCSFCMEKKVKSSVKSRDLESIIHEFRLAVNKGFKHFVVVSDDLSSYGVDLSGGPVNYITLLHEIFRIKGDFTLELLNLNPQGLHGRLDDFLDSIVPGRIKCIILSLQSGSDRILGLMNRGYNRAQFMDYANAILEKDSSISLKTYVIVGFPSETEEDFQQTLDIIDKIPFGKVIALGYDEKKGIDSNMIASKVPSSVISQRKRRILLKHYKVMAGYLMSQIL
ncbi:MAG: radical SAM protein [Candidatus Altiarchaeota archaeon]